jgi:PPM family protein phosphatase
VIPVENSHLAVAAVTHPGMKGKNNEDRYGVSAYRAGSQENVPVVMAVVSDGIGGHRAGEVAAQIAVDVISQVVAEIGVENPAETLQEAVGRASEAIREQAAADASKRGMGATCACAWVIGNRLYTASVGDSRIYLIRGETIRKLTIDHTWVQEAIEVGALTPEQARSHPNAHVIRRYLGSPQPAVADLRLRMMPEESDDQSLANQGLRLVSGDFLLLCSDGLTDLVDDTEILAALKTKSLGEALEGLVELANERGGHDNITMVTLQVPYKREPITAPLEAAPKQRTSALPLTLSCAGAGALLLLGILLLGGLAMLLVQPEPTATPTLTYEPFPTMTATARSATPTPRRTPDRLTPLATSPVARPTYTPWPTSTPAVLLIFPTQTISSTP